MNQNQAQTAGPHFRKVISGDTVFPLGKGSYFSIPVSPSCKNFSNIIYTFLSNEANVDTDIVSTTQPTLTISKIPILTVTGYISYTINYQSFIDTPIAERDLMQQTIQGRMQGVYKSRYPFNFSFSYRFNNSALFKDYFDFGVNYNVEDFKRLLANAYRAQLSRKLAAYQNTLDSLMNALKPLTPDLTKKYMSLSMPSSPQIETERRERDYILRLEQGQHAVEDSIEKINRKIERKGMAFFKSFQSKVDSTKASTSLPSVKKDTSSGFVEDIDKAKGRYDSLQAKILSVKKSISSAKDSLYAYKNIDYTKLAKDNVFDSGRVGDSKLFRLYKFLLSVKSFSIGRTVVSYSDLTVRQLSLNGVNMEFNPGYYFAATAGKIDFRFRDYIVRNTVAKGQKFAMLRFGKGQVDKDHIILSYFYGQRQSFNSIFNTQNNLLVQPGNNLAGISLEAAKKIGSNGLLILEVAKSSAPYYVLDSTNGVKWMSGISNFSQRHNEAYAIKYAQVIKRIDFSFQSGIKYLGAKYQSFSIINTGSYQLGWYIKVRQSFLKKRIQFSGSVQQNEYSNPFSILTYRSTNVIASAFATFRFKHFPVVSLGYYPTQQVLKMADNSLSINQYTTFMATAVQNFKIGKYFATSMLVFNQFKGSSKDSGSYLNNFKSLQWSNSVVLKKIVLGLNASTQVSGRVTFNTVQGDVSISLLSWMTLGGNGKLSAYSSTRTLYQGFGGNMSVQLRKLGEVSFSFDRAYVPYMLNSIIKSEYGRLTYYKTF